MQIIFMPPTANTPRGRKNSSGIRDIYKKRTDMTINVFRRNRHIILYGISLAALLTVLNWLKMRFILFDHAFEIYIGSIALLFTGLGIWLALKLTHPRIRTVVVEKEVAVSQSEPLLVNETHVKSLNISPRELEVLALMAAGLSNREIAARLFVSLSTVKTHSNNLFEKMDVRRRTQAVERGRKLGLIP